MDKKLYVGAIDQGTTSSRFILFDADGVPVASHQLEHHQLYPKPGWVEHDASEIWERVDHVIRRTIKQTGIDGSAIEAIGITNQRETAVMWDTATGRPLCNAIVWQDTRTDDIVHRLSSSGGIDRLRETTGLPLATYFSGPKIRWLIENVPEVAEAIREDRAAFGTVDSWLLYNLTGGVDGGIHVTEVTNASRTLLMDLATLTWSDSALDAIGVPSSILPPIMPSIHGSGFGVTKPDGPFGAEIPILGILGDQQAALFGQACFDAGSSKNTYGTGCFLLMNTGGELVRSEYGLVTTVAYRADGEEPRYALEGSVAVAGALVQWLRDNLGLIERSADIELLASSVEDSGGVYFVPAFSGLFAPHWRPDARGVITGLTGFVRAGHIARAVLEATAFQTLDIVEAMRKDSGVAIDSLRVDGGMVVNDVLMQFQSDTLGVPVVRPRVQETTALGAAYAAGLASGFWESREELRTHWVVDKRWNPSMESELRERRVRHWRKAVERSFDWVER